MKNIKKIKDVHSNQPIRTGIFKKLVKPGAGPPLPSHFLLIKPYKKQSAKSLSPVIVISRVYLQQSAKTLQGFSHSLPFHLCHSHFVEENYSKSMSNIQPTSISFKPHSSNPSPISQTPQTNNLLPSLTSSTHVGCPHIQLFRLPKWSPSKPHKNQTLCLNF